jgi:hypothetical protein
MADASGKLEYVEGYGRMRGGPLQSHAWVAIGGAVWDPTWNPQLLVPALKSSNRASVAAKLVGTEYFGLVFSREIIEEAKLKRLAWGSFLDDWEGNWEFLRPR